MNPLWLGDKPVGKDFAGRQAFTSVFGEAVIGWRSDDVSVQFQYNNSSRDVVSAVTGTGVVANANAMASAGIVGGAGTASITSRDAVRYRPGHECTAQFTSLYEGAAVGVNQYHGLLNGSDGACFGTKDGVFGVWFVTGGVETFIPESEFSEPPVGGFNHDPTKLNLYMVQYGWLGVAPITYSIYMGHKLGWQAVHVIDRANKVIVPHLGNPSLPIQAKVSGTGNAAIRTASWRAGVTAGEAESNSSERWFAHTVLDATLSGSTTPSNVFTLRNKSTFQGKTNHVRFELGVVAFDNSTNKTLAIYGNKGATLSGNGAYADIDTANSVIEVSAGGTVSGGGRGPATILHSGNGTRIDVRDTGIVVYPGEAFTFEVVGASSYTGTFSVSARWREFF